MKKFVIQIVTLLVVIFGSLYLAFNREYIPLPNIQTPVVQKLQINEAIINIEIADTQKLRSRGLSGREQLPVDTGMLFIFPETKKYQFWMKGMKFPLDMIFIREDVVVDILENVPHPLSDRSGLSFPIYEPSVPINKMLEVNTGFVSARNIKAGDKIKLKTVTDQE